MSSFSIGRSARAGENRLLLHLSAPGGGTEAGDPSLCYEGDIHVPDLQIHPPLRTRIHRTLEAEKRRKETREWLRQREREIAAPSIVPEMPVRDATLTPKRG